MRMNFIAAVALIAAMGTAHAQEAKKEEPKHPACGTSAEECQKVLDQANAQTTSANKQAAVYKQLLVEANDRLVQAAAK